MNSDSAAKPETSTRQIKNPRHPPRSIRTSSRPTTRGRSKKNVSRGPFRDNPKQTSGHRNRRQEQSTDRGATPNRDQNRPNRPPDGIDQKHVQKKHGPRKDPQTGCTETNKKCRPRGFETGTKSMHFRSKTMNILNATAATSKLRKI